MKKIFLLAGAMLLSALCHAEDFEFGQISQSELNLRKYQKDTSANAVVLREFGKAYFDSRNGSLMFEYHIRLKIFNANGFKHGNIQIAIGKGNANTFEQITAIKGATFYRTEDGKLLSSQLDPKQIFKESNASKYHDLIKFAMPNLSDGCIIEYSYIIESPFIRTFKTWDFQSDIPKIYSEFLAKIPGPYTYNVTLRGPYKLTKSDAVLEKECYQPGAQKLDCSKLTYAMADVPAFTEEDYMTAASNFKAAIYFELAEYIDYNGVMHKYTQEWKDIERDLKKEESFGTQLKKKDFFSDKVAAISSAQTSELDKAKAIYNFIQKSFKWNQYMGKYSAEGIKKAFEAHTGNSADINLSLITAMNSANLNAEPVILSTRQNGTVNNLYPVITDFDYVICKVNIGDQFYLLDATDPLLPFGLLPMRCINDKGRVMSFDKPSSWIDLNASQKEAETIMINLTVDESGKIKGNMEVLSSGYEAYNKRAAIKEFNSVDEYVENLDESFPKVRFTKSEILNIDTLEKPVREYFEIEISNTDKDQVNVNPFFMRSLSENPFKLAERTYPVDMGAPSESRIVLQMKFAQNFSIVSKPQTVALALPNKGGKFLSETVVNGNSLILSSTLQLNKSIYSPEEYHYLKELFNKIIQNTQTNITLKKKI